MKCPYCKNGISLKDGREVERLKAGITAILDAELRFLPPRVITKLEALKQLKLDIPAI